MRLIRKEGDLVPVFSQTWEVAYLEEQGDCWVPFSLFNQSEPIGEIHAATHQIRIKAGTQIADRQMVVLSPPSDDPD